MSALQIENRSSEAATRSEGYGLADLRTAVLADHGMAVITRVAVGILVAVAVAILVAGLATQSAFAIVGGALVTILMAGALVSLMPVPAKRIRR